MYQSAYQRHHSTETAVLKIISDALYAAEKGDVTFLGMLDMSAAFDTVDHDILLGRFQTRNSIVVALIFPSRKDANSYFYDVTNLPFKV